jgi:hypothetical protein
MSEPISMEEFRKLIDEPKRIKKTGHSFSGKATNVELSTRLPLQKANGNPAFNSPVNITFVHYRHRCADPDGVSCKAAIDGAVACKILADDSAKEVVEVRQRQHKIPASQNEKTEIIFEVVQAEGRLI